jgi:putative endonuclease
MRHDYKYFVYLVNSSSRRVLYTGVTKGLVPRVLEHRRAENPKSFTATCGAFRLVYYEEFGDVRAAIAREKRIRRDWKTSRLVPWFPEQPYVLGGQWRVGGLATAFSSLSL